MTGSSAPHPDDTIVARSSADGHGLRGIVRLSGPDALRLAATFVVSADGSPIPSTRGYFRGTVSTGGLGLPTDVYCWPRPHSYTGQDVVELHTIGSLPLVDSLLATLIAAGARPATPGEFTMRAFLAGKRDLTRAEAVMAVIHAGSDEELRSSLDRLAGGVTRPLDRLRSDLLDLLADVEAGLDFVDEGIEFVGTAELLTRVAGGLAHLANVRRRLTGRTLSDEPVRVVLVGEPNAGKSSLFNRLTAADTAIVSPLAGTTRDYLTARLTIDGIAIELVDTPGWEESADDISSQAQTLGAGQSTRADVILHCVPWDRPAFELMSFSRSQNPDKSRILVRTKADGPACIAADDVEGVPACHATIRTEDGLNGTITILADAVGQVKRAARNADVSRCRGHVDSATAALKRAHDHVINDDPQELLALALRESLEQIGEMVGTVHTNDLLDRIFGRFCIGK